MTDSVKFSGEVIRLIYNSDDFKVYALNVNDIEFPDIKKNKYGNVSISGELMDLTIGCEYEIEAVETMSKNGTSYNVINISRNIPKTANEFKAFLDGILTPNQSYTLFVNYPDIVQRVKDNNLSDIDFNKLDGIGEKSFEKIKKKIIENFCMLDYVAEFKGYLSINIIKKMYKRFTSIDRMKYEMNKDPYKCLCSIGRVGFKTADAIILKLDEISKENIKNGEKPILNFDNSIKESKERCVSCIVFYLKQNEEEGHTKMNLAELRKMVQNTVPECFQYFTEAIKDDSIYYNKETMSASLKYTRSTECYIAKSIIENVYNPITHWDYDVEKYRKIDDVMLSDEQIAAVRNVCKYNISILNGQAGSGKSFSTQAIINMLTEHKKSFMLLSPTGKAAKVLSDYTKCEAKTIHRGLGFMPPNKWGYDKNYKINTDIVIVDEFSMVDIFLFSRLIDAIDFNYTKLLMIGDNAQLCSVGCGNLLHDFMESNIIPTVTLTKIFRYGEGGLMKVATDARFCKPYLSSKMKNTVTGFGKNKDYVFLDKATDLVPKATVSLYDKLLKRGYTINDIQVLTSMNKGDCGTKILNDEIQKIANENYGSEILFKSCDTTYYVGDLVIQKSNNYKAKIFNTDLKKTTGIKKFIANGESGIILDIQKSYMVIKFNENIVQYAQKEAKNIGLGYAITVHKAQGSGVKIVILCTPQSHTYMLNSNLLYVGLTRMKETCYHIGTLNTVNLVVKKKANLSRNTFMQDLLTGKDKIDFDSYTIDSYNVETDEDDDDEDSVFEESPNINNTFGTDYYNQHLPEDNDVPF